MESSRVTQSIKRMLVVGVCLHLAAGAGAEIYTDVTASAGVAYAQHTAHSPPDCLLLGGFSCQSERMTGGAAAGDVDGDGLVDLYVTRLEQHDLLFRNEGDGTFEDITVASGLAAYVLDSNAAAWVDIEKDGDLDLILTVLADTRTYLFVNDGSGVFTEEALARGAAAVTGNMHVGTGVAIGDYDGDGYPDIFIAEWRPTFLASAVLVSNNRLLRNLGAAQPGHFEDKTVAAGVDIPSFFSAAAWVFSPAFVDLDDDGLQDLVLASDFGTSQLFWNDGDGTFSDGTVAAGVGTDENGMGSTFGDYDGDGDLDWFVTSIHDPGMSCPACNWGITGNRLYRNDGARNFSDATDTAGVRAGYWGWGAAFFESDNDGDLDLVMTNGMDLPESTMADPTVDDPWEVDPVRFWRNDGVGGMTEDSTAVGLTDTGSGKGLLTFDFDADGDLDLFVVNNVTGGLLLQNDGGDANDWLQIETVGTVSTTSAWGTRIEVQSDDGGATQLRVVGASTHFLAQSDRVAHFGLGAPAASSVHSVTVTFPSGFQVVLFDVARNQRLTVVEPLTDVPLTRGPALVALLVMTAMLSLARVARRRAI